MRNELYRKVITGAFDSADGETPTALCVTEEANCVAIWLVGYHGQRLLGFELPHLKNRAIERAVAMGDGATESRLLCLYSDAAGQTKSVLVRLCPDTAGHMGDSLRGFLPVGVTNGFKSGVVCDAEPDSET